MNLHHGTMNVPIKEVHMYSQIVMAACLYLSLMYNFVTHNDPLKAQRAKTTVALLNAENNIQRSADKMNKYIDKISDMIDKDIEELDKKIDDLNKIEDEIVLKAAGRGNE
jgi:peptidoglycan hydrolase CwlO-like protein